MKNLLKKIKDIFKIKDEKPLNLDFIASEFQNIMEYNVIENQNSCDILIKDLIPKKEKNSIEFIEREIHSTLNIDKKIKKTFSVEIGENIINYINYYSERIKEDLDKIVYYQLTEMGRITSAFYSKSKDVLPILTISKETTSDSLLFKIKYADGLLKELNGIGIKNITISRYLHTKLSKYIVNNKININNKMVDVFLLPSYLDTESELCLLLSSIDKESKTPGLFLIKNIIDSNYTKPINDKKITITLEQSYALEKYGTNNQFFYLRFFKT